MRFDLGQFIFVHKHCFYCLINERHSQLVRAQVGVVFSRVLVSIRLIFNRLHSPPAMGSFVPMHRAAIPAVHLFILVHGIAIPAVRLLLPLHRVLIPVHRPVIPVHRPVILLFHPVIPARGAIIPAFGVLLLLKRTQIASYKKIVWSIRAGIQNKANHLRAGCKGVFSRG
ncbi:hypothetical protein [Flaviaesturariibacter aridisoli]|uniref:Uncharacterized protein n=1 Tax=Flaviaesturariibacter aridisoli TaxID=2545761 RepID=A0A4R4E6M2_9BACT|nr:hypothetical protein [Flaviaesturariibacter aridisoli]TCZ74553.1 hypothetical protein E0486_02700 [Flaviaesturariibacter aridisoli]